MMEGLRALLAAEATITTYTSTRIYLEYAQQGAALPYIIISQLTSEEFGTLDNTTGILRALTIDINCKAARVVTALALSKAVRAYIQDYSGAAGSETIDAVILNNEQTDIEQPTDGTDVPIAVANLDLTVQYRPT